MCGRSDNVMVKANALAFRWREMLENGTHPTIAEIAAAEKINDSYLRLGSRAAVPLAFDVNLWNGAFRQPFFDEIHNLTSDTIEHRELKRIAPVELGQWRLACGWRFLVLLALVAKR